MNDIKLFSLKNKDFLISEAFKTLRTNIQFSSLDKKVKTIMITSSCPGEGKTTTSCNLAIATAQAGNKTLLLDCDLRNPKLHRVFSLPNTFGLTDALIGAEGLKNIYQESDVENLYILPSGTKPPNPSELLSSDKMKNYLETLKEVFDYIIIDTPPIVLVTDAQVVSRYVDGTLLVIAAGEVDRNTVLKAKELLEKVNSKILGVVLNKYDVKRRDFYGNYYGYYEKEETKKSLRKKAKKHKGDKKLEV